MRITQSMLSQAAIDGMQSNLRRLSDVQQQAVTTKRISRPEDDPAGVQQALDFRQRIQTGETLLNNLALSSDWLNATDESLNDLNTLLIQSQDLALRGASDTLGAGERQSLAAEVNGLLEQALPLGNSQYGSNYLFSGYKVDTPPFTATRDGTGRITAVTYQGDNGSILHEVEPGITMGVNVVGQPVFGAVFDNLLQLRDALQAVPFSQDDLSTALNGLTTQMNKALDTQAAVGAKLRRIDATTTRIETAQTDLKQLLSHVEDADMAEVISQLNQHQYVYQNALAINARTLNVSLLDFLK